MSLAKKGRHQLQLRVMLRWRQPQRRCCCTAVTTMSAMLWWSLTAARRPLGNHNVICVAMGYCNVARVVMSNRNVVRVATCDRNVIPVAMAIRSNGCKHETERLISWPTRSAGLMLMSCYCRWKRHFLFSFHNRWTNTQCLVQLKRHRSTEPTNLSS